MMLSDEIKRRLTFAIISHPDAGKTTITEKLLLFGGAIHIAGAVKSKKNTRKTVSDFMELEKERGISISTSVMGFDYNGRRINLLDTPGHADFSEDTYRTLTAVDSSLMVIDSVKGVEERTRQLAKVCRMRTTPIITFMNKLDREGRDPIELMDEVEEELDIVVTPATWPIGRGKSFRGVYSIFEKKIFLFRPHQTSSEEIEISGIDDPVLETHIGSLAGPLREEVGLVSEVYPDFDFKEYRAGRMTPVFFGSALNNFGVQELLEQFTAVAPEPLARESDVRIVLPEEETFSGLVFKIHANLDPRHRDRIAYMRICSGVFERNKTYFHVRSGKPFRTSNPTAFMAQERTIVDQAFPGDIIGIHDTGTLRIGDTITEGEELQFVGVPHFAPQIFRKILNKDPLKSKQLDKGLDQLSEEGVVQIFRPINGTDRIIGVVGALQLDVVKFRLEHEYRALCDYEALNYTTAAWVSSKTKSAMDELVRKYSHRMARDPEGNYVYLAENPWLLQRRREEEPEVEFRFTSGV